MTLAQLKENLSYVDASRKNRQKNADLILEEPSLVQHLLVLLFKKEQPISTRAAWVLEYACSSELKIILPYLDYFTEHLKSIDNESSIRPIAKICELLVDFHFKQKTMESNEILSDLHQTRIIEICFDYLIEDHKVAPKAYSMKTLEMLGKEHSWVHQELKDILIRDFYSQSKGFQARAKHIIKRLN